MGILNKAKDLTSVAVGKMWVVYGKSGSGKTAFIGSFPKPMLYIQFGDDGYDTLQGIPGIQIIRPDNVTELKDLLVELRKVTKYKSVVCDTFSLLVEEWTNENATKKKKRMSQQMWGDLKSDASEIIQYFKQICRDQPIDVVLTCHEVRDMVDGLEDEILPDIRPSMNKGARTYLEAMANIGIHMAVIEKEVTDEEGNVSTQYVHGAHVGPNPYYWTKLQKPKEIKVPSFVPNITYTKLISRLNGKRRRTNGKTQN